MSQYASFYLDGRWFGIELTRIREIDRVLDITPVPGARSHIRGLLNLRGQIVTALDLGVRLGLPRQEAGASSHIVILKTRADLAAADRGPGSGLPAAANDPIGLLVDDLGDVVEVDPGAVEPPSANVGEAEARFLAGVAKTATGLLVLLDLGEILFGR